MSLIDKIKKARESNVEIDGVTFTIRRPTEQEAMHKIFSYDAETKNMLLNVDGNYLIENFVVGWSGVKELDLIPGGDAKEVDFDTELLMVWIGDRMKMINKLPTEVVKSYTEYMNAKADSLGEQEAG